MLPENSSHRKWHIRVPTNEQYERFRKIVDIHNLTRGWLTEIESSQSRHTHLLPRVDVPGVEENLWMLERLSSNYSAANLEELLDESEPSELLDRLERTAWVTQSWTFREILNKTPESERGAMLNLLEQSSWKSGRASAAYRWGDLPRASRQNLRSILSAFLQSHISGFPSRDSVLVRRATPETCEFELLNCPHQSPFAEVKAASDPICLLHYHWLRGFGYELNTTVTSEYFPAAKDHRCLQRWFLPTAL